MIVKNGAETIRPCLESARSVVEQIVIADTGCTDNTCDIAREFGATIVSVPWQSHFANARNAALAHMTTDWVLMLDADEELDRSTKETIPGLLTAEDVGGYITPIRNYMPGRFSRGWDRVSVANDYVHERAKDAPSYIAHENCRLFRRHPGIYFAGRVHELVENQVRAAGFRLEAASFFIHHFGQLVDHEARTRKREFYRDLMRRKTEDCPGDPAAWVQLGLHEFECFNETDQALRCFEKAITLQPHAYEAWLFTGMVYVNLGRYHEALDAIEHDQRKGSSQALHEDLKGDALMGLGKFKEARLSYRRALQANKGDPMVESKLGYVEVKLGQKVNGLMLLRRAARAAPQMYPIQDRLMKGCIMVDRLQEAAEAAERCTECIPHPRMFLRAASIHAKAQQWNRAEDVLSRGMRRFPQSPELGSANAEIQEKRATASVGSIS
jgi:glycosyltransferase involved in cell wall biosynthesis